MTTANFFYYKAGLVPPHYNFPTLSLQEPTVIAMCNNKFKPLGLKWFKFPGSFRLRFFLLFFSKGRRSTTISVKAIQLYQRLRLWKKCFCYLKSHKEFQMFFSLERNNIPKPWNWDLKFGRRWYLCQ